MTQNEVSVIKNAVLDATEAYVDARLSVLDFVRTQIGVVLSSTERNHKYYHTVRCNATQSNPNGITYNNVLSVGNIPFPENSVVFLIAPNAQFSNQFILGKLDDTPCNIVGGSIDIGNGQFVVDKNGNVTCKNIDATGGRIAGFTIGNNSLHVEDTRISPTVIGCGSAGYGIVNIVGGGSDSTSKGYLQLSNSGDPYDCRGGIRIFGSGKISTYDTIGVTNPNNDRYISNIPIKTIYEDSDGYLHWS